VQSLTRRFITIGCMRRNSVRHSVQIQFMQPPKLNLYRVAKELESGNLRRARLRLATHKHYRAEPISGRRAGRVCQWHGVRPGAIVPARYRRRWLDLRSCLAHVLPRLCS
jgi:hypothetical protein